MLKKVIALILTFSFLTAHANTGLGHNGLKSAFDELNYSLSVEWDQKDKDFYDAQMNKFNKSLDEFKAQGGTKTEIFEFVRSELKNEKVAREFETLFNLVLNDEMESEAATLSFIETMKKSYSTGASWDGDGPIGIIALTVGALGVMVFIYWALNQPEEYEIIEPGRL